ncbi:MAG: hypothetical protein VX003_15960, partial [SAR324 cluster bacterium]|nr:hypothetical protein [SAR324 cluster bacterium]
IYVADYGSNLIRKIDPLGYVSTIASSATFQGPHGIVVDEAGNIFVADRGGNKIRKIDTEGNVSDFAGSGEAKSEDGQGTEASFDGPFYLDLDASGNLYVTEYWSNLIRKISPGGLVSTFAGTGTAGSQDGDRSTATFNGPNGIALDEEGNVYVSENINHQIRKIDQDGHVTTLVGLLSPGSEDGDVAQASFNQPHGMTFDDLGNLYVAEYKNNLIRKITRVSEEVEFQINLVDAAGNQATRRTLTEGDGVRVDLEGPVLSDVSIISDNDNVSWGREGDNITLSFTSNETIQTPDLTNISIVGLTDLVFTSLNDNNTRWQVTGTVDEDAVSGSGGSGGSGFADFSISVTDQAGNTGSSVADATGGERVALDVEAPVVNAVSIRSSNDNSSLAKAGDNITLEFSFDESIQTPDPVEVTIQGADPLEFTKLDQEGKHWQGIGVVQQDAAGGAFISISVQDYAG